MKKIILLLFTVVIIIGAILFIMRIKSYQTVEIKSMEKNSGLVLDVYHHDHEEDISSTTKQEPAISSIPGNMTFKLKNGGYRLVSRQNDKYEQVIIDFNVSGQSLSLDIVTSFSDKELASLLPKEKQTIDRTIMKTYPSLGGIFVINGGKLFKHGEWYATTLTSKSTSNSDNDTLRIILEKKNGNWDVITKPPDLVISNMKYPDVPKDVIKSTNAL